MTQNALKQAELPEPKTELQLVSDGPDTVPICQVEEVLSTLAASPKLPGYTRTRNVREQFQYAFELIGGIPRLAHWAHQNPDKFYNLYSKLIPTQVTGSGGGPIRVELSWINGRDTSGRSPSASTIIDVLPTEDRPHN